MILYFFVGILFMILSIPLIMNRIKVNKWYGIRFQETLKDETIWYKTNNKFGKKIFILGIFICVLSSVFYFTEMVPFIYSFIFMTLLILIGIIVITIQAGSYAKKIGNVK